MRARPATAAPALHQANRGDYIVVTFTIEFEMKTRIVRIGNSQGIRIPKPLLEQAGLTEDVELRVRNHCIVIAPASEPRAGWAEAAELLHKRGEDGLLDKPTATTFDKTEWEWE